MNEENMILKRNYKVLSNQLNSLCKDIINLSNTLNNATKIVKNNLILDNRGYKEQELTYINEEVGMIIKNTQSLSYQVKNKSY